MTGIIIENRTFDYMAIIEGKPGKWESGKNEDEAVGKLIIAHSELFNIENLKEVLNDWQTGRSEASIGRLILTNLELFGAELKINFRGQVYEQCRER